MPSPYAEILLPATRDRKPYRLWCEVRTDPRPTLDYLKHAVGLVLDRFVADMHKQGWEYVTGNRPKIKGPFPVIEAMNLRRPRRLTAKEMLPGVTAGQRFRAEPETLAHQMPVLEFEERWMYKVGIVFHRPEVLTEWPDPHEEEEMLRKR